MFKLTRLKLTIASCAVQVSPDLGNLGDDEEMTGHIRTNSTHIEPSLGEARMRIDKNIH